MDADKHRFLVSPKMHPVCVSLMSVGTVMCRDFFSKLLHRGPEGGRRLHLHPVCKGQQPPPEMVHIGRQEFHPDHRILYLFGYESVEILLLLKIPGYVPVETNDGFLQV